MLTRTPPYPCNGVSEEGLPTAGGSMQQKPLVGPHPQRTKHLWVNKVEEQLAHLLPKRNDVTITSSQLLTHTQVCTCAPIHAEVHVQYVLPIYDMDICMYKCVCISVCMYIYINITTEQKCIACVCVHV